MPDDPHTPSPGGLPPSEPTRLAGSEHPSGDTWRNPQSPTRIAQGFSPEASAPYQEVIGDFEIIGKLGQGGMGAVYRARQVSLDRQVALKILPAQLEADAEYVARFQREARVAASLNHPNLVRVYSSGATAGCHFIAMELVEGETLADWVRRGPMSALDSLRIILDVTHALDCGWRTASLIHRDIKPGNIFLSNDGAVKLGDLGLAKTVSSDTTGLTQTGTAMGTPHYISPEQARGDKDLDYRADIYSLGCTLYQMLTGRTPYEGRDPLAVMSMHLNAPPPAILKVMPQCPIPLVRLVGKMLKKQRRERQASYEELIAQIESVRATLDPSYTAPGIATPRRSGVSVANTPAPAPATPIPPAKKASNKMGLYGGVAAGVLALGIGAWLIWPKEEKLTAAQRYAKDHAGEKKEEPAASAVTESKPLPSDDAGSSRPVAAVANGEPWQPFLTDGEWKASTKDHEWKEGAMQVHGIVFKTQPGADGAVRARLRITPELVRGHLLLRSTAEDAYMLVWEKGNHGLALNYFRRRANETVRLAHYTLPAPVTVGETVGLELRVQGTHLTGKLNGVPVIDADDERITAPGEWAVSGEMASYESVETLPLPAGASSTPIARANPAPTSSSSSATDTGWQPLFPEEHWRKTTDSREFVDGIVHLKKGAYFRPQPSPDAAIRARMQFREGTVSPQIELRATQGKGKYIANFYGPKWDYVQLLRYTVAEKPDVKPVKLGEFRRAKPSLQGDSVLFELRAQGANLTVLVDGVAVIQSHDAELAEAGEWGISGNDSWVESVEVEPLGSPAATAPEPLAGKRPDSPATAAETHATVSASPSDTGWQPLVPPAEWQAVGAKGREYRDGLLHMMGTGLSVLAPSPDGAVRARLQVRDGIKGPAVVARHVEGEGEYLLSVLDNMKSVGLAFRSKDKRYDAFGRYDLPTPLKPGDTVLLELRVQGTHLVAFVNGIRALEADDSRMTAAGRWGFSGTDGWFESAEVQLPTPPAAGAAAHSEPPAIKLWDSPEKLPKLQGVRWEDNAVKLVNESMRYEAGRDLILRFSLRATPESASAYVVVRGAVANDYRLKLNLPAGRVALTVHWPADPPHEQEIGRWTLAQHYGPEEYVPVELRVVGDTLTVSVGGQLLGSVHDATYSGRGAISLRTPDAAYYRNIEYVPLDGVAAASAAEPWQDVLHDPAKLYLSGGAERTPEGLRFTADGSAKLRDGQGPQRDGAIRMRTTFGDLDVDLVARELGPVGMYKLLVNKPNQARLERWEGDTKRSTILREFPLNEPLQWGQEYELELRVVAQTLTAKLNGVVLGTVTDGKIEKGRFGIYVVNHKAGTALIKSLEVLDLDAPAPGASVEKAR